MAKINKNSFFEGDPINEIAHEVDLFGQQVRELNQYLSKTADILSKQVAGASSKSLQQINAMNQAYQTTEKLVKQTVVAKTQEKELQVQEQKLKQELLKTQKAEQQEKERAIRQAKREEQLKAKSIKQLELERNEYKRLTKETRDLKNESKRLGAVLLKMEADGRKNEKAFRDIENTYKKVTRQANLGDKQLKRLDKTVGDNWRSVGHYEKGLQGLTSALGKLGIAFGIGAVVRSTFNTIKDFDSSIRSLVSITGAAGEDLDFYKEKAIELGKEVQGGAASVIEAYKLIGSAKPELLSNAEALNGVTEAAIKLSQASGLDLPDAATRLTDAMNQFGAPAEKAGEFVNVLANGALFGAAAIPDVTDALLKFGAAAGTSNVNLEESTALIETLAQKGLKGAEAGTALRNVMLKLSAPDALPKEAQERLAGLGISMEDLSDKSKPFADRLEVLKPLLKDSAALQKVFGQENAIAATNLINMTDTVRQLTADMETQGTADKQAAENKKTLAFAVNNITETFNGYILKANEAGGIGEKLAIGINYLADNFETIVGTLGKLVRGFIVFKTTMFALKMKDKISDFIEFNKGIEGSAKALKGSVASAKAFGAALKGIGLSVAISLLIEMATAMYDIASGAREAKFRVDQLNEATARGAQSATKVITDFNAAYKKRIDNIREDLSLRKITQEQADILYKEEVKNARNLLKAKIEDLRITKERFKLDADRLLIEKERARAAGDNKAFIQASKEYQLAKNAYDSTFTVITQLRERYNELNTELFDATITVNENTNAEVENTAQSGKNSDAKEKLTGKFKQLNREVERNSALMEYNSELLDETYDLETQRIVNQAEYLLLQAQINNMDNDTVETRKALYDAEVNLIKAQAEADKRNAQNQSEKQLIDARAELEIKKLEAAEAQRIADEQAAIRKERFESIREYEVALTKMLEQEIDRRIALQDKEVKDAQKQQDYLTELAKNGNISAQQSITEQIEIERAAEAEKKRLEAQKQQLQLISAGLQTYTSEIGNGASPKDAFLSTVTSSQALVAFLKQLSFFATGTDYAPQGYAVVDEQGAEIITDSRGNLKEMGTNKGARLTYLNKGDKVITAPKTLDVLNQANMLLNKKAVTGKTDVAGTTFDLMPLLNQVKEQTAAIKAMPHSTANYDSILKAVTSKERRGGNIIRNSNRLS